MHLENLAKLGDYLKSQGLQAALLSNPATITWLTGYAPSINAGPSPFEGGPTLGWFQDGALTLLLNDWEAGPAEAMGVNVATYVGYTIDEPLLGSQRMAAALGEMLSPYVAMKGKVGVEMNDLPAPLYAAFQAALSKVAVVSLERQLDPLRAVKTPEELAKIRAALQLCDLAQAEIRKHLEPGLSELDLWGAVKSKVELQAGCRVPVLVDCVAGARTGDVGGPPAGYTLKAGDPVMLDFVPRLDNYWGDNCAVWFVGEPAPELKKIYDIVRSALQAGTEAIRPGVKARDLDALLRNIVISAGYEPYPHHSGHGMGASYHEEPRIVPYNEMRLEAGMVLALEPGIYLPGVGGVRLENAFLVTPDGCEVLTTHLSGT
jgi:Xaa-Pro aminopeptidase